MGDRSCRLEGTTAQSVKFVGGLRANYHYARDVGMLSGRKRGSLNTLRERLLVNAVQIAPGEGCFLRKHTHT